jgi:hypothetical protein
LLATGQTLRARGPAPMKPSALRIERLLAKVEAESRARPRRYCFHFDEVAEAEAQGLPYVLVPRQLSREEWEKKYCIEPQGMGEERRTAGAGERRERGPETADRSSTECARRRASSQRMVSTETRKGRPLLAWRDCGFWNPKPAALVRTAYRQCLAKVLACPRAAA